MARAYNHSPDVQQKNQLAFLQGSGKAPDRPSTPELLSFRGEDSATGKETSVVVATVTPSKSWDRMDYLWSYQLEGEAETETVITQDPRLVIKDLPIGKTVKVWVQARSWAARGLT